jgi:U3 small nucleolar RNA-associated protein 14
LSGYSKDHDQNSTNLCRSYVGGKKKNKQTLELPLQPGGGSGPVTIHDLLENNQDKPGHSKISKMVQHQEKRSMVVQPPLPKVERDKIGRRMVYDASREGISKWGGVVKGNREAHTLCFKNDLDLGVSTVGAIASKFEPRSPFEKKMAGVIHNTEIMEAHKNDGAKILELNKVCCFISLQ